jgi:hypothetical protein
VGFVFRHPNYYKQLKEKYEQEASSNKQQAMKRPSRTLIRILHEEWALNQGLRPKHQAASIKRQAASLKHVPRYVASDYKATSVKRQALTKIPSN